ncbi:putative T7SS-secreted protein, partial [Actinacidiphila rubida]|uniref:putative T7SS-secreted protein n=1 Tax=Actinacidiphila rubida TaxID=310780 RepID=UPI00396A3C07
MARPGDWSALGLHGDPTPGDPDVLQSIYHEMDDLGGLAREITSGLNRVLDQSSDGFVGKTAEAVRKKIDGHLKKFIDSVGDSFGVAAPATMDYLNAIKDAQAKADQALAGAQGLSKDDPALAGWKSQVHDAQEAYRSAAGTYFDKLSEASHMIQQPISGWKLFLEALGILGIILAVLGAIFGGWVGLLALAVNVALLIKTAVDFAEGKASVLDLVLAVIGVLFPSTKGLNLGSMSKGIFNALKNLPKTVMSGLTDIGRGLTHIFTNPGSLVTAVSSLKSLPGLVINGLLTIGRVTLNAGKLAWSGLKVIGGAIRNDFHLATIGVQGTLPRIGVYAISFGSRFLVSATLPLDFFELGVGARAAIKMGLGTRLTTPWAHLSQPIVSGGVHLGATAGGHFGVHTGTQTGFHDITGGSALGGVHGLNLTSDAGGLHNLPGMGAVHLGGVTPTSLAHSMSNVSPGVGAVEHLTAFDHATGFDRTSSGLLTPSSMHFGGFDAGTSHLGAVSPGTVDTGGSHLGSISSHTVRTDLTGSATGLRTTIDDSFSGFHNATSHVENFQALGISELKSIVDGDVSVGRITPDSISLHVGAQSGTPTALHMNFRTMSLTNDAGQQVVVGPEVHSALGTAGDTHVAAHAAGAPPVDGGHLSTGSGEFKAAPGSGTTVDGTAGALTDHGVKVNGTTPAAHGTTLETGKATFGAGGGTFDTAGAKLTESGLKPHDTPVRTEPGGGVVGL